VLSLAWFSSYRPTGDDSNDSTGFQLKDYLQRATTDRTAEQLISVTVALVSANREIRKESLDRLFECDGVRRQFVSLEVILEVSRLELIPLHHRPILSRITGEAGLGRLLRVNMRVVPTSI